MLARTSSRPVSAVLHGLGRFGLHLLRAWLDRPDGGIDIVAIQDAHHSLASAAALLQQDAKVSFADCRIAAEDGALRLDLPGRQPLRLAYWHGPAAGSPWLGRADWWLECSGDFASGEAARAFLRGRTRRVIVSATCPGADQTLVFGYNHEHFDRRAAVLSYGSCTVNAFVPLAAWLHARYGVAEAEVGVIHNVPPHRLAGHPHPVRRPCTLQTEGPRLLPFLAAERFHVDYVLIPYTGPSLIDFRFELARPAAAAALLDALQAACSTGPLRGLYALEAGTPSTAALALRPESAVLSRPLARLHGRRLVLPAGFDNENSAVRYLDLLEAVAQRGG
ncbi:hypothetical protein [Cupriavidus malaysiensis]|uniref:hypothetical protein n=1 Tax=Cupriavidus malaysiensis TaxID=367825 RepID=UPI000AC78835|nr:hypothetical protein [Cupriavidus malaysiensis]